MWVPKQVIEWFSSMKNVAEVNAAVSVEAISGYREQLAAVMAERDALKLQAAVNQTNFDWLRFKVNSLEAERAALIELAYKIKLPVPEIAHTQPPMDPSFDPRNFTGFEDVGEAFAKHMGLPSYTS
jgi:hypothetical protein